MYCNVHDLGRSRLVTLRHIPIFLHLDEQSCYYVPSLGLQVLHVLDLHLLEL